MGAGGCVLPLAIGISLVFRIIPLAFSTRDEEQLCSLHVVVAPGGSGGGVSAGGGDGDGGGGLCLAGSVSHPLIG